MSEKVLAKGEKTWESKIVEHKGFRDLGNYVIELPDYDDPEVIKRGLKISNSIGDHGMLPKFGCTAMAKRNSKGEVITGRNMDLDISQNPAYVFRTTCGKYSNFCVSYSPGFYLPYSEVQKLDDIDPNIKDMLPLTACDCINEKGLYIEVNLREMNEKVTCYGLHSSHGEKYRDDGIPWSELRACSTNAMQLVSQNCATVREAVEFLKNSYDWYTVSPAPGVKLAVTQNNMCFLVGDATGEYGVIEFAQDQVNFIPYQFGHANFYLTPRWNALDIVGAGEGRLQMVSEVITKPDTLEEMMDAMKPIMWRNETLWIGESERIVDGTRLNPYDQLRFQDNKGNRQIDWRGDYAAIYPVLDDGRLLLSPIKYEQSKKSTYDPKIKEYFDIAIERGTLVIDDGSIKFDVKGEKLTLSELYDKYVEYLGTGAGTKEQYILKPYFDAYRHLLANEGCNWVHDDTKFEALKAVAYESLHTRYDADGNYDPTCMSKYEKLLAFYGYGVEKNEKFLRDDATIWTTSLNVGVNCAQKEMKIRFWENDEVIYKVKF